MHDFVVHTKNRPKEPRGYQLLVSSDALSVIGSRPGTKYCFNQYLLYEEMEEDQQGLSQEGKNLI